MSTSSVVTHSGRAMVAGVIGWPVTHSRSPRLHMHWIRRHRLDAVYVPFSVPPGRMPQAIEGLVALGLRGANVTLPHKEAAHSLVHVRTAAADRAGAVNTLIIGADGRITGDSTDGGGFVAHLRASVPEAIPGSALVLGAGGAARCVAAALADAGWAPVLIANRSADRAEMVAAALGPPVDAIPWSGVDPVLGATRLLVNATQLGMEGQPPLDVPLDRLPPDAIVADIVYVPLETPLLAAARARGHRVVDGLGMLLHQAQAGFAAWFGIRPEVDDALRAAVLAVD